MKQTFKTALSVMLAVVLMFSVFAGCTAGVEPDTTTSTTEQATENPTDVTSAADIEYNGDEEVTISKETIELVRDTKEDIKEGEDLSTDKIPNGSHSEEDKITDEGAAEEVNLEEDGTVEQENISYDGANTGKGKKLLGPWQGITFYAQNDSRWANVLYTSCHNKSQTIKSSGCGPTSAAMVVSSSKGAILPTTMAKLYVDNGYRTKNNGTAWAAMAFTADYFGFKEFYTTTSYDKIFNYLKTDKNKDGVSDYFVILTCGSGLWTTGGHYIAVLSDVGGTLGVRDPYPYLGKYNTASRKNAKVKVSGNIAYVPEAMFKKYSNMKQAFIFSNDHPGTPQPTPSPEPAPTPSKVKYVRYVATKKDPLLVRSGADKSYPVVDKLPRGTKVTVTAVKGGWSKIGDKRWVNSSYLSATKVNVVTYKTKVGSIYKLTKATYIYSNGNLTGKKYSYKANTKVKVLSHYSTTVDKVKVIATGRVGYIEVKYLK